MTTSSFSAVNLTALPFPAVVEELDFEAIFALLLADLQARDPIFTALVESDPAFKVLEVAAYHIMLLRSRVNDAAKAVTLAYAVGSDLDHLAANFNVERLLIDEGDAEAIPPVPPTYESDTNLRRRVQLSFEGMTTAGSKGSYIFHALSAHGEIRDVAIKSPVAGQVLVTVQTIDGSASPEVLNAVNAKVNAEDIRPLTDQVIVQSVTPVEYVIDAAIMVNPMQPDAEVIRLDAVAALNQLITKQNTIGRSMPISAIYAALHRPNVLRVDLLSPVDDVEVTDVQYASCTMATVIVME